MSEQPTEQPVEATLVIDDKYKADGVELGAAPVIQINNLDRVVRMKLEVRGTKLYGFVNYNQSHNKSDRAKNGKTKVKPPKLKDVKKEKPFTLIIQNDADQVFDIEPLVNSDGKSIYIELLEAESKSGGPTPAPSRRSAGDTVAMYVDNSDNQGLPLWLIITCVVLLLLLIGVAAALKKRKDSKK